MAKELTRDMRVFCTLEGAAINVKFPEAEISQNFRKEFEKLMNKKGIGLTWVSAQEKPDISIRFVEVDQGNQLLRYLFPFLAPAKVEIEGEWGMNEGTPNIFSHIQKAQVGVFGGNPRSMIQVCVNGLAKKLTKEIA